MAWDSVRYARLLFCLLFGSAFTASSYLPVENTGKQFDADKVKAYFDEYREQQMDKLELEFDGLMISQTLQLVLQKSSLYGKNAANSMRNLECIILRYITRRK